MMPNPTGEVQSRKRSDAEPTVSDGIERKQEARSFARLKRSWYMVILTLAYSGLALYAWIATCYLTFRPIPLNSYGFSRDRDQDDFPGYVRVAYETNQRWLQSARVIQAIVAVLTIPLTSAVCSRAAVVYIQARAKKGGLSLRQTMALADRGWTDVVIYAKLLLGQARRYGTPFLIITISLNILGGLISPLQSLLLTIKTVKAPTGNADWNGYFDGLSEVSDILNKGYKDQDNDQNLIPVLTRSAITSASHLDPQARLWTGASTDCSGAHQDAMYCHNHGIVLGDLRAAPDPFLAQLPVGYNTGVMRQFLPRINSSGTRESIDEADFPSHCEQRPDAFYAHYEGGARYNTTTDNLTWTLENDYLNWTLTACMPGDQTQSPWKLTRARQDFAEYLYLNLTTFGEVVPLTIDDNRRLVPVYLKITLNTTAGYFELPNYMNGQKPGPLLQDDFTVHCGDDCANQILVSNTAAFRRKRGELEPRSDNFTSATYGAAKVSNSTVKLEKTTNRGPLLNLAIALFGNNSFIADRVAHPKAFLDPDEYIPGAFPYQGLKARICTSQAPLVSLFGSLDLGSTEISDECIFNDSFQEDRVQGILASFVSMFWATPDTSFNNVLAAAAFLTNEIWLTSFQPEPGQGFRVAYDEGVDTQVPVIALPGIIIVSVLLATYLTALLTMAVYGSRKGTWTEQLDTFAMMRIGAAIADQIALKVVEDRDKLRVLDELPGWIGEESHTADDEVEDEVGRIGLGAAMPLLRGRRYECLEDV